MKQSLFGLETQDDQQHLKGRLEAFSDIVFGFSLAQLAGTLKIPAASADWAASGPDFVLLGGTFILLCSIWWSHYRLFRTFFVVSPIGVMLNFLLLGAVLFLTYPLNAILHIGVVAFQQGAAVWLVYFLNMAVIFGFLSLLYLWQLRRDSGLSAAHWTACAKRAIISAVLMGSFLLAILSFRSGILFTVLAFLVPLLIQRLVAEPLAHQLYQRWGTRQKFQEEG